MNRARILVVEDEELVGLAVRTYLESIGYEVPTVVPSGELAIKEAGALEPDLVLMDIRLSGAIDGIEAAAAIKDSYHIPVIYLTAYSDAETLKKAKATEPYGYVLKPFDERALEASVEMALHKAAVQEELHRSKERFLTILQSMGDGIIVAGMKGFVEYVNSTAATMLKLTLPLPPLTSIVKLLKLTGSRNKEPKALPLDDVLLSGVPASCRDCVIVTADGIRRIVDLNLEPHRDERGVVRGVVVSFRDVSEPRKIQDLVEEELQAAADLRRGLLPSDGTFVGPCRMHAFLFPATFGAGDIYGLHQIDDTHAGFYIVDIVGHGIAAASIALLVSSLLAPNAAQGNALTFLRADPHKPREVVARMNDLFYGYAGAIFFTMCYGVIDLDVRRLHMVRAGHPFPILVHPDGSLEEIEIGCHAIGLASDIEPKEVDLPFAEGDRLFLYSDGLPDCGDPRSVRFSRERLVNLIRDISGDRLPEAIARIAQQVASWRGKESYDDDITLVGVEMAHAEER